MQRNFNVISFIKTTTTTTKFEKANGEFGCRVGDKMSPD